MTDLPTGTVTFLFTDIESSTALWEQHHDTMRGALARHDVLIEQLVAEHDGYVVRPRGEGDSRFAVFARATDAVAASAALQQALYAEPWPTPTPLRVRMALHTGEADLREGDYYGSAVNRCARLRAVAHGGQTLVTLATEELARDQLPIGLQMRDLGECHLKDLIRPEHIFQLVIAHLPAEFPPLKTLDNLPNNLPLQPTPFVGRDRETAAARQRLLEPGIRLLTLTGSGGTGKTRLCLQVAADLIDMFADGVWFVELGSVGAIELVVTTIVQVLGIVVDGGRSLRDGLKYWLRDKHLLLVLDNFEQVLPAAPIIAELLQTAPRLKVMVTSRAALRLRGEHEFGVPPLELPPLSARAGGAENRTHTILSQYEAVALFITRAQAVKPDFVITNANAPAVAEICVRLDGLPLAIELAAARTKLLTPQGMLHRLEHRLLLLNGGAQDLPIRQQTLRKTIDWSFDLLQEDEQALFARLAVFVSGCTLEAVEAVAFGRSPMMAETAVDGSSADPPLAIDVLDGIESLVDKSLMRQAEGIDGEPRFVLLETMREYALEKLDLRGEHALLQRRHAAYYLARAEQARPMLRGAEQGKWLQRLEADNGNLRAAFRFVLEHKDLSFSLRFGVALWRYWEVRGQWTEGRVLLKELLRLAAERVPSGADRSLWAKVLQSSGALAFYQGDYPMARSAFEQSLALYRELDDPQGISWSLIYLGWMTNDGGDPEGARPLLEESLSLSRASGDWRGVAWSLARLGLANLFRRNYVTAQPLLEESLALSRTLGDRWAIAWALHLLAFSTSQQDHIDHAYKLEEESIAIWRELHDRRNLAYSLWLVGSLTLTRGELASAREFMTESLTLVRDIGDRWGIAIALWGLSLLHVVQGNYERAVCLAGATDQARESLGATFPPQPAVSAEHLMLRVRRDLAEQGVPSWAEGRAMSLEQAIAYALEDVSDA